MFADPVARNKEKNEAIARGEEKPRITADTPILPQIKEIVTQLGVTSIIVLADADAETKLDVRRAFGLLAQAIEKQCGIKTYAIRVPGNGEFKGLDDWLVAAGAQTVKSALASAASFPPLTRKRPQKPSQQTGTAVGLPPCPDTDLANARRLRDAIGKDVCYCSALGWFIYDGRRWVPNKDRVYQLCTQVADLVGKEALKVANSSCYNKLISWRRESHMAARIRAAFELLQYEVLVEPEQFEQKPWLLNCLNGTLDLRSGELRPHKREDFITHLAPVVYDPKARAPLWEKFLARVMPDAEIRAFLRRLIGYALTGCADEHIFPIAWGSGNNGKSTFTNTILQLLGTYGLTGTVSVLAQVRPEQIRNDIADLAGARFVSIAETDEQFKLNEGTVKHITGGGKIRARQLYAKNFEFSRTWLIWLETNSKPVIRGTDQGIWRRVVLIPWLVSIPKPEIDPQLGKKLRDELPGILNWAVDGVKEYLERGLDIPDAVRAATDEYRADSDDVARWLQSKCIQDPAAIAAHKELYNSFLSWARGENINYLPSSKSFAARLEGRGFVRAIRSGQIYWRGLALQSASNNSGGSEKSFPPLSPSSPSSPAEPKNVDNSRLSCGDEHPTEAQKSSPNHHQGEVANIGEVRHDGGGGAFLTTYNDELKAAAETLVLDIETTSLTPFAQKARAKKGVNDSQRVRVITVGDLNGNVMAWDLDQLNDEQKARLAFDAVNGRVLVGHNLTFDLSWLAWLAPEAKPKRVVDSMLVVRVFDHGARFNVHELAVNDETLQALLKKAPNQLAGVSLEHCCAAYNLPLPDKSYQKPENWVEELTPAHYSYVADDVTLPLQIVRKALRLPDTASIDDILAHIDGTFYAQRIEPAIVQLAQVHRRGLPIDSVGMAELREKLLAQAQEAAEEVVKVAPQLEPVKGEIARGTETNALRNAIASYLAETGRELPTTAKGVVSLSGPALKQAGLDNDPVIAGFNKSKAAAKRIEMLDEWQARLGSDGRIHGAIGIAAVTNRLTSAAPNIQNLPRDAEWRAIVRARPGHKIISIDFGQIELRIAAGIAVDTFNQLERELSEPTGKLPKWLREPLLAVRDDEQPNIITPENKFEEYRAREAAIMARAYRHVRQHGMALVSAFRDNIDPHLLTALIMAARAGIIDLGGKSPIEFIKAADQAELKKKLAAQRQAAKALNFGLLYGMSAGGLWRYGKTGYGLSWSEQDAEAARQQWFDAYQEITLWHAWVRHACIARKVPMYAPKYDGQLMTEERRVWRVKTLTGRTLEAIELRDALNYSDQSTGADLLLMALTSLPKPAADYLIDLVHDELLFEVPDNEVEAVTAAAKEAMLGAGRQILTQPFGIPVDCEVALAPVWQH
jgi:P4 family phage/plasmid primase-like protien